MKRATFKGATDGSGAHRVRVESQTFPLNEPVEVNDTLAKRLAGLEGFKFTITDPDSSSSDEPPKRSRRRRSTKTD